MVPLCQFPGQQQVGVRGADATLKRVRNEAAGKGAHGVSVSPGVPSLQDANALR